MENTVLDLFLNELSQEFAEEEIVARKQAVDANLTKLKEIQKKLKGLQNEKILSEVVLGKQSQLSTILNAVNNGQGAAVKLNLQSQYFQSEKNLKNFSELVNTAYDVTSQILQNLNLNPEFKIKITYFDGNTYYMIDDLELTSDMIVGEVRSLNELKEYTDNSYLSIKLNQSAIKEKLKEVYRKNQTNYDAISEHYKSFLSIFTESHNSLKNKYSNLSEEEQKAKIWKPNMGVVAEAFQRHWERKKHSMKSPPRFKDFTKRQAWELYILSSGNDPYYTGPDTEEFQVKSLNASIITNANTVLNTMQTIQLMLTEKVEDPSGREAKALKEKYRKAFSAKKDDAKKISEKLEEAIETSVGKQVEKQLTTKGRLKYVK